MPYTRREFGQLALAGVPAAIGLARLPLRAQAKIPSRFGGVQVGVITYSFRSMSNVEDILTALVQVGIGEVERFQDPGAEDREHSRVGADPEREHQHDGHAREGVTADHAQAVDEVSPHEGSPGRFESGPETAT